MGSKPEKGRSLIDVFCASCGAPAYFDIPGQYYNCAYCGSRTGIREALDLKQEFRSLNRERISKKADEFELFQSNCTGCGARVLFMENEASAVCGFCGRKLIRSDYLSRDDFPELIIPFRLTPEEAKNRLETWCVENSRKKEARLLKKKIGDLEGFYLPFVLVKGPCSCSVRRNGASRVYNCRSYLDHMFVATSKNVNNLVVNGTEPYNLDELRPFDFSFVAGHRLRVSDLDSDGEKKRISEELSAEYGDFACRTMETAETSVDPSIGGLMTMSVVLPAYYLRAGNVFAAVNGQTGRVAVEEQRVRKTLPWRVKPVFWSLLMAAVCFLAVYFFSKELEPALFVSGGLLSFFLIVFYSAYQNHYEGDHRKKLRKRILSSPAREPEPISEDPVFYETIEGEDRPVRIRFTTVPRILFMALAAVATVFLPILIAFVINGFSFAGLKMAGAGVWLCITVPLAPVFLLNASRLSIYENPLIWLLDANGKRKRYRKKRNFRKFLESVKDPSAVLIVLAVLAVVCVILAINVELVLHWDKY